VAIPNPYGDIELDARAMRALAHPVRLAILERLRQYGADTATGLSTHVAATPSVVSWHLRHLAEHGLVQDSPDYPAGRKRWWEASARGFRFAGSDATTALAARSLERAIELVEGDLPAQWRLDTEPVLEPAWRAEAGRANTRIVATLAELAELTASIENLLAPYVLRKSLNAGEWPVGSRGVRLLIYTLPEAELGSTPL
jgi:DNA-binding transcriptional ArsR family regulator